MALATYVPVSHEHTLRDGSVISVTGLSLNHIARLINHHFEDIEALFDLFQNLDRTHNGDLGSIVAGLISDAPGFVANVIALAANEPEAAPQAEKLPFPLQLTLLTQIAELTFEDVGGVKKGMETIAALLIQMKGKDSLAKTLSTL